MQCPHRAHIDSIRAPAGVSNATVARAADGSFKHYDEAKIRPSSNRPVSSIWKGWGCELKIFWKQIKRLPTIGYGTELLKAYENFIPNAKHCAAKTYTKQIELLNCWLRHYLARLHHKTHYYSKSKTVLDLSLKRLMHQLNKHLAPIPILLSYLPNTSQ